MQRLSRKWVEEEAPAQQVLETGSLELFPERVIQFGEGNFLRAFVDWMFHTMNRKGLFQGRVVVVQPIEQGWVETLNEQDGLYTLYLRGLHEGAVKEIREVITSVSRGINPYTHYQDFLSLAHQPEMRYMVSNTTEAGIAYMREDRPTDKCPRSFPAKVTAFLYERFLCFRGDLAKGMVILPCELINHNGTELKNIVLRYIEEWDLGMAFREWLEGSCHFLNTLVDRIVTGYQKEEAEALARDLGVEDPLLDTGEYFHLWVIEGDSALKEELPFDQAGINVIWTDHLQPYRERKVRILNGAHTMTVPAAFLHGLDTVRETIEDPFLGPFMKRGIFEEVLPVVDLPMQEKREFAEAVLERFANPFIEHRLLSITLNSISKYRVRVLPSLLDYISQENGIPPVLSFSLAALIVFYSGTEIEGETLVGKWGDRSYPIRDDQEILIFFAQLNKDKEISANAEKLVCAVLSKKEFWGEDLTLLPGLLKSVSGYVRNIQEIGIVQGIQQL